MITIRPEQDRDAAAIRGVNEAAFGRPDEANLVDALRQRAAITLSLVAVSRNQIVGHILFSPVTVVAAQAEHAAVALGPMAVLPAWQRQGVGSRLVRAGLGAMAEAGHPLVIVLGHPGYYPRFGFVPASRYGIRWENEAPDEVFMAAALSPDAAAGIQGTVRYQPEFSVV